MVEAADLGNLPVIAARLRRYGDQYGRYGATPAKLIGNLESSAAWHFEIEKRNVRMELCCFVQCLCTAVRESNVIPFAPQQDAQRQGGITVVIGHQHAQRGREVRLSDHGAA